MTLASKLELCRILGKIQGYSEILDMVGDEKLAGFLLLLEQDVQRIIERESRNG